MKLTIPRRTLLKAGVAAPFIIRPAYAAFPHGGSPPAAAGNALNALLATMSLDTWKEVASSDMVTQVSFGVLPGDTSVLNSNGSNRAASLNDPTQTSALMFAWSGATYNAANDMLVVWGGGHQDYASNDIYGFKLSTLQWQRLSLPSDPIFNNNDASGFMGDGRPRGPHTYDTLVDLPNQNVIMAVGGEMHNPGDPTPEVWWFNPAIGSANVLGNWVQKTSLPFASLVGTVKWDSGTQRCYYLGGPVYRYDPANDAAGWNICGVNNRPSNGNYTSAIQPGVRGVVCGSGSVQEFNIGTLSWTDRSSTNNPSSPGQTAGGPGFVWHPPTSRFVSWPGGQTLYILDQTASPWAWTAHPMGGATPACNDPGHCTSTTGQQTNGTYGRFQYLPAYSTPGRSVFVAVNTVFDKVAIALVNI